MASTSDRLDDPVEPDIDRAARARHGELASRQLPVVVAVAIGGAVGAAARYACSLAWPTPAGGFPWATLGVNVVGCSVIGLFMVLVTEVWLAHRLVRPFIGTGVLGGFTTFSTYAADILHLVQVGRAWVGLSYLAATPATAVLAAWATATTTRAIVQRTGHRRRA